MADTPIRHTLPYPSFEEPPPRAISTDALLGKLIRRMFEDATCREEGLAGTLKAVLHFLEHRATTANRPSR